MCNTTDQGGKRRILFELSAEQLAHQAETAFRDFPFEMHEGSVNAHVHELFDGNLAGRKECLLALPRRDKAGSVQTFNGCLVFVLSGIP